MTAANQPGTKPEPTQARALARRALILEVAHSFVVANQIDAVTTTSVAARANIPVGSVYRYFKDRTDILNELYRTAYNEVESELNAVHATIPKHTPLPGAIRLLLNEFTRLARAHPSFRALTRWANKHYSLWEVTPGINSNLSGLIQATMSNAGISFKPDRKLAAAKTAVTVTSVLIDLSLEEEEEQKARDIIEELAVLLEAYLV